MQSRLMNIRLALLLAAALPAGADAAVYKWTDAQGVLHYDDRNASRGQLLTREYVQQRAVKPAPEWAGVVPAEFARGVEQRCQQTRERLAGYRAAPMLYRRDPGGNTYALSAAQSRLLLLETERDADNLCAADAPRRLYRPPVGGG